MQGLDGRVGHHCCGVAVVGARTVGATVADTVDPFLELGVVGGDETLAPVLRHPTGELVVPPNGDRAEVTQGGSAGLADHLAADVVAVADVDAGLDVHQRAAAGFEHQQQRVLAARRRGSSSAA